MSDVLSLRGKTFHGRKGAVANRFTYCVDYVLLDPETARGPRLFSRNRANLTSLWDRDHGGPRGQGRGSAWVRDVLRDQGLPPPARIRLLAQTRVLGHVFNPVSFWLIEDAAGDLRVVIAEVTNTYGERHSYLCHRDNLGPIGPADRLGARKIFYVSPFQPVVGEYEFTFDITPARVAIRIDYRSGPREGLVATLAGDLRPLTNAAILGACLRRPFGSRRVLALIHWQALRLWWKGVGHAGPPAPPAREVTR